MSMALDLFWWNSLVAIPSAVELSTWMAVGNCGQPMSERVVRMGTAVWELMKMVPYYSSDLDAMVLHMILHTTSKMPLVVGTKYSGFLGSGGPSVRNELHWIGFWIEQMKGRRRMNGWPIASHSLCIGFLLVDFRWGSLRSYPPVLQCLLWLWIFLRKYLWV